MDELKKFSSAILAGAQQAMNAPGVAGVSDANNRAFASRLRSGMTTAGGSVGGFAGKVADDEQKRREIEAAQRAQRLKDLTDPSKYQRVRKEDGGFAFYDPEGKEIGIDKYSARTGMRPVDILKDSDNPLDQQYISDYTNMNELMKASFNGEDISQSLRDNGFSETMKPESFMQELIRKYPHIYGVGKYEDSRKNLNKPVFKIPSGSGSNTAALLQAMLSGQ